MKRKQSHFRSAKKSILATRRTLKVRWRNFKLRSLRRFMRFIPNESQRVFILTLVIGAASGLAAVSFHLAIMQAERLLILPSLAATGTVGAIFVVLTPAAGGLLSGLLLNYVAPGARGSGIPQVKLAYAVKGGRIPLRDVVGKFFISALQIGSGGSLGREGPTVHICAGLATWLGETFALSQKNVKRLLPVGVAAGIAAAFNAPIAAVTFTIEEIVGDLDQTVLSGVIVAAAIAAAIERGILGEHPVFTITQSFGLHYASSLVFYVILGLAAGGVSLVFSESLLRVRGLFRRFTAVPSWAHPAIGGLVTGILIITAIHFFSTGGINGAGYETLSAALDGKLAFKVMAVMCLMKLAATVSSYSSGGAGGIFAPSLFVGGMLGGFVGYFDVNVFHHPTAELGAFALVGMGAVFAGVIRAPITSVLIIFEMTGSYGLILPLMIANMISYGFARRFRHTPVYEALLEQDDIYLPHPGRPVVHALEQIRVADAMRTDVVTLSASMSVKEASTFAQEYELTTFPVLNDRARCVGVVTEMRLRRNVADGKGEVPVGTIADGCHLVFPDQFLERALHKMNEGSVRQLSVVKRGGEHIFIGIITMTDIVRVQADVLAGTNASVNPEGNETYSSLSKS